MARLADMVPARSFGFQGPQGEFFDIANQLTDPRLSALMERGNVIIGPSGRPQYLSAPLQDTVNQARSSLQDLNSLRAQEAAFASMDTPEYKAETARRFMEMNPDSGFTYEQLAGRMPGNFATRMTQAKIKEEEGRLAGQKTQAPTFNAELGGFIEPPSAQNPQGRFIPLSGVQKKAGKDGTQWKYDAASDEWVAPPSAENPQGLRTGSVSKMNAVSAAKQLIGEFRVDPQTKQEKSGLLYKTPSGGMLGYKAYTGNVMDTAGAREFDNLKEMLSTQMRTIFRIPGEGALSDKEQAQYGLQLPDRKNQPDVNERILTRLNSILETRTSPTVVPVGNQQEDDITDLLNKYQ